MDSRNDSDDDDSDDDDGDSERRRREESRRSREREEEAEREEAEREEARRDREADEARREREEEREREREKEREREEAQRKREEAQRPRLVTITATVSVSSAKPDGRAWDGIGGGDGPDPFITISTPSGRSQSGVLQNSFNMSYTYTATLQPGDVVGVDVTDKDVSSNDPIASGSVSYKGQKRDKINTYGGVISITFK